MSVRLLYEVGDNVRLTSGGADMTVESVSGDLIGCTWIDKMSRLQRASFAKSMLRYASNYRPLSLEERNIGPDRATPRHVAEYRRTQGLNNA